MRKQRGNKNYRLPANYSTVRAVLDILLDLGESITAFDSPYQTMRREWRRQTRPELVMWRYNRAMQYLKKRGEIAVFEKNNKRFVKLTKKGKVRALLLKLCQDFKRSQVWDGKWRGIIWDIPEKSSKERDKIRRLVKVLGFYPLQKSVFITPYPLPASAVGYLKESGLDRYIRFLRVDKLDNEKSLKKHFGVKRSGLSV